MLTIFPGGICALWKRFKTLADNNLITCTSLHIDADTGNLIAEGKYANMFSLDANGNLKVTT